MRRLVTEPGTTVLSPATANRLGIRPGQDLALRIGTRLGALKPIGLIEPEGGEGRSGLDDLLIADIATAQTLLGMAGRISHIDLALAEDAAGAVAEGRMNATGRAGGTAASGSMRGHPRLIQFAMKLNF